MRYHVKDKKGIVCPLNRLDTKMLSVHFLSLFTTKTPTDAAVNVNYYLMCELPVIPMFNENFMVYPQIHVSSSFPYISTCVVSEREPYCFNRVSKTQILSFLTHRHQSKISTKNS